MKTKLNVEIMNAPDGETFVVRVYGSTYVGYDRHDTDIRMVASTSAQAASIKKFVEEILDEVEAQ